MSEIKIEKSKRYNKVISFTLDDDSYTKLTSVSVEYQVKMSNLLRAIVVDFLDKKDKV